LNPGVGELTAPFQPAPGAHPASHTMDLKQQGHGINHLSPSSAKVKDTVELYI